MNVLLWGVGPQTKGSCVATLSFPHHSFFLFSTATESFRNTWHPSRSSEVYREQSLPLQTAGIEMQRQAVQTAIQGHNSALNIYSEELGGHLVALSQDKHMLCVPLHNCPFCFQRPLQWTFDLVSGHPASECSS